jgi:flagellar biosynthetic protein FliQ
MLWITALVAAPVLLASLAVGLVVGIIQAATSVNEQTLTFVPKLAVTALIMVLLGGAMLGLRRFMKDVFAQIAATGQYDPDEFRLRPAGSRILAHGVPHDTLRCGAVCRAAVRQPASAGASARVCSPAAWR